MNKKVALSIEGLKVRYGSIEAIKGINIDVCEGSVVALLGANGAGKTTTLQTVSGLVPADAGKIKFYDQDITNMDAEKIAALGIAQSPEGRQIFGDLTVAENLKVGAFTLKDKKVMICGSGGTCKTVTAVAEYMGAKEILVVSRSKKENAVTYEECIRHKDVDVVVNASPKGMYPDNGESPLDLSNFPNCKAVVDVIYNPLKTRLLQQAEQLGMKAVNGLEMLVAQAKFAVEHFLSTEIENDKIDQITLELLKQLTNIVLIGMPSSGKTLTGKALCKYIDKTVVDTDAVIVERSGMSIKEMFARHGEAYFRQWEHDVIEEFSKQNGLIIATGGGAIKNEENIQNLKQNGVVMFIDRDLEHLLVTDDRPLSKDTNAVAKLYEERYPLYTKYGDLRVPNNYPMEISQQELDELMNTILEGYHEILCHQWA